MKTDTEIPTPRLGFGAMLKWWVQLQVLLITTESLTVG